MTASTPRFVGACSGVKCLCRPLADEVSVPTRLAFDPTRLVRVPGVVRAVAVGVGDVVRPGDLLLSLDSATAAATRAEVGAAQARARALQGEGVGSRVDVERAETELAAARASLAGFMAAGTAVSGTGRAVRVLSSTRVPRIVLS